MKSKGDLFLFFLSLLIFLAGCSQTSTGPTYPVTASYSGPTTLQISRDPEVVPVNTNLRTPPFAPRVITNAQAVQQLYEILIHLPEIPPTPKGGTIECGLDLGINYHLRFLRGNVLVQTAEIPYTGLCIGLGKNGGRRPTDQLWPQFSKTLGMPLCAIAYTNPTGSC